MTSQESVSLLVLPSSQCLKSKCFLILFHSYKAQKDVTVVVAKTDCESEILPSAGRKTKNQVFVLKMEMIGF